MVKGDTPKELVIDTLIPASIERFPWGGHLGIKLVDAVVAELEKSSTTLVFTNVRSQAEIWYQTLLAAKPEWAGIIALHHGSLDRAVRDWVEAGLKAGTLKAVVCTSSLDLGVDFLPVERVLQIGSREGRRAAAAARGAFGPRAGSPVARDAGADERARTDRGGRGATRGRRAPHRAARCRRPSRSTVWCSTW